MMPFRIDPAVISDLAANIFAAFLLILLILMQSSHHAASVRRSSADSRPIDVVRDLRSIERAPLRGGDMVALLYQRRADAAGLSIDIFESRIVLQSDREAAPIVLDPLRDAAVLDRLDRILRVASPQTQVRLYVFGHRWYAPVIDRLARNGFVWSEISVPVALRDRSADAWSNAFVELLARPLDQARFRDALARLLAGSASRFGEGAASSDGMPQPHVAQERAGESLMSQISRGIRTAFSLFMIAGGIGVVILIEWRTRRSRGLSLNATGDHLK